MKEKAMSRSNIFLGILVFFGTLVLMRYACAAIEYQGEGSLEQIKERIEETNSRLVELNNSIKYLQRERYLNNSSVIDLLNLNHKTLLEVLKFNSEVLNQILEKASLEVECEDSPFDTALDWEYHQS